LYVIGLTCLIVIVWGDVAPNAIPHFVVPLSVQKHTAMFYLRLACTIVYMIRA